MEMKTSMPRNILALHIRLALVLVLLTMVTSCAPSGPVIKIMPTVSSIKVDDNVKVPIKIENIENLTAFEIHLSFNSSVLEVVALNGGDLIKADFTVQNTFDNTVGTIDYAVAQINRAPVNGSGAILEIVFHAKAKGDSPLRFRGTQAAQEGVLLSDTSGKAILVSLINSSVNVK
jgi:hypothetical protein